MKTFFVSTRNTISLLTLLTLLIISTLPSYAELPVVRNGDKLESPFAKVYDKVAPTVVKIEVKGEVESKRSRIDPWEYFFNIPRQQSIERRLYKGMGSGVIVDREGYILTNNHVIESPDKNVAEKIKVTLNANEEYEAEVVGREPETDLAVIKLKLDGKLLPPEYVAEFGDSDSIKPGDYAIAIGNPLGFERSITVGVISAVGRYNIRPYGADRLIFKNLIQTDAQINPGNSGGALADIDGKIIGINNIYAIDFAGIGFAVPINQAKNVITQIIATGEVKRGFVGLVGKDISKDLQEAMNLPTREGALIEEIVPDYPAEKAGLEHGDIITSLDGKKIKNFNEFRLKIADHKPGDTVNIGIIRDGKKKTVSLKLADLTEFNRKELTSTINWRGIHVVDFDNPQAKNFELDGIDSGVVIIEIAQGSPASETTLRNGDVITEINYHSVDNTADFLEIKNKYKDLKRAILIYRLRKLTNGQITKAFVAVKNK